MRIFIASHKQHKGFSGTRPYECLLRAYWFGLKTINYEHRLGKQYINHYVTINIRSMLDQCYFSHV